MNNQLEDEVLGCINPEYRGIFYNAIAKAIVKYEKLCAGMTDTKFKKRTQANIINDFICQNIEKEIKPYRDDQLYAYEQYKALRLSIQNGKVVVRFKKMNSAGSTSNIITQEVLKFENQTNLFGDKPTININVGYFYNGLDCQMMLSHPNGTGVVDWIYPLEPAATNVAMMPTSVADTTTNTAVRTPRARKGIGKDDIQQR